MKNDLKILFDATSLASYNEKSGHRAGIFFVALNLLKEFRKLGIDITIYCEPIKYYKIKNIEILKEYAMFKEHSFLSKFVSFIFYILGGKSKFLDNVLLVCERVYCKYILSPCKNNITLINQYDAYFSPFTPASKDVELSTIKKFRLIHDVIPLLEKNLTKNMPSWYWWHNRVYSTINEKDFYFSNSEYTKKDVLKLFPFIKDENIKSVLLGVDESFKQIKNSVIFEKYCLPEKYVFSLGTIGKRKNLSFTIKNFCNFIKQNNIKDLYLVIAGSMWQSFKKEFFDSLQEFDLDKILFIGYVDDEDLPALYSNAFCFVFPSLYEGFGLPVLEAMKCGCPVITSNTTSLPEVIGEAGIKIDPQNEEEMVKALTKMYKDDFYRQLCSERGIIRARNFSWEKCAKEILDFIQSKNTPIK